MLSGVKCPSESGVADMSETRGAYVSWELAVNNLKGAFIAYVQDISHVARMQMTVIAVDSILRDIFQ